MTDDHTVETLRLRTAALHRISRTNDELRARLADAEREIERLRAKVAAEQAMVWRRHNESTDAERERDELRAKVENIARRHGKHECDQPDPVNDCGCEGEDRCKCAGEWPCATGDLLRAVLDGGR